MGEAKRKLQEDGQVVTFDFSAPQLHMMKGDRKRFATEELDGQEVVEDDKAVPRAVRFTIAQIVQAAFPQGADRKNRKIYAAWLECMEDDTDKIQTDVTIGQVRWLLELFKKEDLKLQASLSQWAEAITDYLETLQAEVVTPAE